MDFNMNLLTDRGVHRTLDLSRSRTCSWDSALAETVTWWASRVNKGTFFCQIHADYNDK